MTLRQYEQRFMFQLEDEYNIWGRSIYGNWEAFVSAMHKQFKESEDG